MTGITVGILGAYAIFSIGFLPVWLDILDYLDDKYGIIKKKKK